MGNRANTQTDWQTTEEQRDNDGLSHADLVESNEIVWEHCTGVGATATSAEIKLGSTKLVTYAKEHYKAKIVT